MKLSCWLPNSFSILVLGGLLRKLRHCDIDDFVVLAVLIDVSAGILWKCEFRTHILLRVTVSREGLARQHSFRRFQAWKTYWLRRWRRYNLRSLLVVVVFVSYTADLVRHPVAFHWVYLLLLHQARFSRSEYEIMLLHGWQLTGLAELGITAMFVCHGTVILLNLGFW